MLSIRIQFILNCVENKWVLKKRRADVLELVQDVFVDTVDRFKSTEDVLKIF